MSNINITYYPHAFSQNKHTHTHKHTHIYVYMYMYMYIYIYRLWQLFLINRVLDLTKLRRVIYDQYKERLNKTDMNKVG